MIVIRYLGIRTYIGVVTGYNNQHLYTQGKISGSEKLELRTMLHDVFNTTEAGDVFRMGKDYEPAYP